MHVLLVEQMTTLRRARTFWQFRITLKNRVHLIKETQRFVVILRWMLRLGVGTVNLGHRVGVPNNFFTAVQYIVLKNC